MEPTNLIAPFPLMSVTATFYFSLASKITFAEDAVSRSSHLSKKVYV